MRRFFEVENDYTLSVTRVTDDNRQAGYSTIQVKSSLTTTFNFLAQTVTYETRENLVQESGYKLQGAVAVSTQMAIRNFSDFDTQAEIDMMRAELIARGGNPPEPGINKTRPVPSPLGR